MNAAPFIIGCLIGLSLGMIATAILFIPRMNLLNECLDNLLDELDEQEQMDERFVEAANRYRVSK